MKGVVQAVLERMGIKTAAVKYDPNAGKSFLHPGRQAVVTCGGQSVAYLGEVHPGKFRKTSVSVHVLI